MIVTYDGAAILPATVEFVSHTALGTGTTYTRTGVDFGTAVKGKNRKGIIALLTYTSASSISVNVTSPTIGGFAATQLFSQQVTAATTLRVRYVCLGANVMAASGDIIFTDDVGLSPSLSVFRCVNLDATAAIDTDINAGTGSASLSLDCPAGGGILAKGQYGYGGGASASSVSFANLSTLFGTISSVGDTMGGSVFAAAQTALSTTYDPVPNTSIARCEAVAFSLAKNPLL